MGSIIYNDATREDWGAAIGQVNSNSIIYKDSTVETWDNAIGHVSSQGIVYSDPTKNEWEYAIGHVNYKGIVYSDPTKEEWSYAVGHVNDNGIVYSDPTKEEWSCAVGHVSGPYKHEGAAALLLMKSKLGSGVAKYGGRGGRQPYGGGFKLGEILPGLIIGIACFYGAIKLIGWLFAKLVGWT